MEKFALHSPSCLRLSLIIFEVGRVMNGTAGYCAINIKRQRCANYILLFMPKFTITVFDGKNLLL
jgi:hypothetical protein